MPGRIRQEDIAAVRERSPIVDVVGEYLQLRPAGGGSFKGLCPFHDEKTPSFNVTPGKELYYCLAGETRVLTHDGVRPIRELAGGTHRILGADARWVDAPFYSFGQQPLMRLTLSRNGVLKEIYATPEHRWFVRRGKRRDRSREVLTRDLRSGDALYYVFPRNRIKLTTPSPFGIAHGITFGDGTLNTSGAMAQLDEDKDAQLLKWFPVSHVTQSGRQLLVHHLPRHFKELPSLSESAPYLYGWLAGYVAADGCVSEGGTVMLHCADRGVLEHVRAVCTRLGIGTYGISEQVREGFEGRAPSSIYKIVFVNSDLTDAFFLLDKHRLRFQSASIGYERRGWVVKEVSQTRRVEEVFCAVVESGHAFVLEDNILTGNCFSCNAGGDVIRFVQNLEHLSFTEAIERLAARAGIELRYEQGGYVPGQETSQRRRLLDAHKAAQEFYAEQLTTAQPAREFLAERGFELADAERFGMGYSPAAWDELTRHLRGRGFTDEELTKSGLARQGRRGLIDMFRGRLLWPVRDLTGETVAFGARKLDADDDGPKYLNTPETALFKKGHVLYGLDLAKREIGKQRRAVIVEGYTDVMACHLSGVQTAVATCGTSFGEDHVKVLRRLIMDTDGSGEVIFTFDGDPAGQKAALRAFGLEEKFVTQTFVAVQPDGLDPCDLRLKHGEAAVRDLIARRVPLFEFAIRAVLERHDLDTTEGRFAAIDEAAPIITRIKDRSKWKQYAVDLDRWIGFMDEKYILDRVRRHAGSRGAGRGGLIRSEEKEAQPGGYRYDRSDPLLRVEREALKLAVQWPALCGPEFDALGAAAFAVPVHGSVAELIARCDGVVSAGRAREWVARLLDAAPEDRARAFVNELAVEPLQVPGEPDEKYADIVLARVGELAVGRQIAVLKARLQRMNPEDEQAAYGKLFGELVALEQRRKSLLERAAGA